MKQIAIVYYNTPELTEACILSIRKVGCDWPVTVLDNSDKRPFTNRMKGVKVLNNRKQQLINFDQELANYPNKCWELAHLSNYGSVKHMMSVQYLWGILKDGFILVESDVLITQPFDFLWDEKYAACGKVQWFRGRRKEHDRLLPWLCYMNVPLLTKHGAKYYDPLRSWALQPGGMTNTQNWYDTGACLLEDIIKTKPALTARLYPDLDKCYLHYNGGSWRGNDMKPQAEWLKKNEKFFSKPDNGDAKIFICAHTDFEPVVKNEVYETIDSRKLSRPDVPDLYYSELWQMKKVSERKNLPKYIGFCHYRRYFGFMDNVPEIGKTIETHGAITTKKDDLGMRMVDQYATWGNPEDLDICTQIISEKFPDFAPAWKRALNSRQMHLATMSIMRTEDWLQLFDLMWAVAQEYLRRIGGDIVKRVEKNHKAYHIGEQPFTTFTHELRVGGQFAERINSAWIDWKFPNAYEVPLAITREKIEIPFSKPETA